MRYILKCGKTFDLTAYDEETGAPALLTPVGLGRTCLDSRYRHESRPVPEKCQKCTLGNKFTFQQTLLKGLPPDNMVEVAAEVTVCYAVLDPKERRRRERVVEELIAARKQQLEEKGDDSENIVFDDILQFLAIFSEKRFRFVPHKAYKGEGFEPMPEIFGVIHLTNESDFKIMSRYGIAEDVYQELAELRRHR